MSTQASLQVATVQESPSLAPGHVLSCEPVTGTCRKLLPTKRCQEMPREGGLRPADVLAGASGQGRKRSEWKSVTHMHVGMQR